MAFIRSSAQGAVVFSDVNWRLTIIAITGKQRPFVVRRGGKLMPISRRTGRIDGVFLGLAMKLVGHC